MLNTHLYKIVPALEELITSEEGGKKLTKFGKSPATVSNKCQVSGVENKRLSDFRGGSIVFHWGGLGSICIAEKLWV